MHSIHASTLPGKLTIKREKTSTALKPSLGETVGLCRRVWCSSAEGTRLGLPRAALRGLWGPALALSEGLAPAAVSVSSCAACVNTGKNERKLFI